MENSKLPMAALAEMLTRFVDRPVVDMTEMKGDYQVVLNLSMDDMRNAARAAGVETPADACRSSYPGSVLRQMGQRSMKRLWRQKLGILARAAR